MRGYAPFGPVVLPENGVPGNNAVPLGRVVAISGCGAQVATVHVRESSHTGTGDKSDRSIQNARTIEIARTQTIE